MDINGSTKEIFQLQTTNTRTTNLWKPQPQNPNQNSTLQTTKRHSVY